ncbi:MAG TPA: PAS domain S-box protein [Acidobacteriota bacterium]|nr:PAS domain S-box protein [Acidobacteriota bacterium]
MSLLAGIADVVAIGALLAGLVLFLRGWRRALRTDAKLVALVLVGLGLFLQMSTILAWWGISSRLEAFAELGTVLVPVLFAWFVYALLQAAAQRDLRESEERFRLLAELSPDAIVVHRDERIVFINQAGTRMLGADSPADLISTPILDFIPPDFRDLVRRRIPYIQETRASVPLQRQKLISLDGRTVDVEVASTCLTYAGTPAVQSVVRDVTERKRTEEALREREAHILSIIESLPFDFFALDGDGRYTLQNSTCRKHWGDAVGKRPEDLPVSDDVHALWARNNERAYAGETVEGEVEYEIGAEKVHCYNIIAPIRYQGQVRGILGVNMDITERKRAEAALTESQRALSTLMSNLPGMAYRCANDRDWTMQFVSDGCKELTGYEPAELVGNKVASYAQLVHEDDREDIWNGVQEGLAEHLPFQLAYRILTKAGDEKWVWERGRGVFSDDGALTALEGFITDITERRRAEEALRDSEQKFREIAERAPEAIYEADSDGVIKYANRQAFAYFGYTLKEHEAGLNVLDMVAPSDRERAKRNFYRMLAGERLGTREYTARRKDGTTFPVTIHSSPVIRDGKPAGVRGLIIDITDRKRREKELLKAQKLESVSVLAGGIAHDFNNLLTGVLGNISLVRMELDKDTEASEWLEEAEQAALRARDLTQQLLTFARGGEPVKKVAAIDRVVKDCVHFALRGSNVRPEFSIGDDLYSLEIDTGQISQVLHNLVLNADQAMPDGGTVTVCVENVTVPSGSHLPLEPGRYVRLTVKDEGVGIPQKHLQRIFDPYFTTKQIGSGLGLASSYSIVNKHGGHIEVESEPGAGSVFRILLPACEGGQVTSNDAGDEGECDGFSGAGRVLVMDDESSVRELTRRVLGKYGYTVDCTDDGSRAVELYKRARNGGRPFDVVILDLTVPGGMGGKQTIAELRRTDPEVRAIACSGYSNDPVMANHRAFGFDAVVAKPYVPDELVRAVREVTSKPARPAAT